MIEASELKRITDKMEIIPFYSSLSPAKARSFADRVGYKDKLPKLGYEKPIAKIHVPNNYPFSDEMDLFLVHSKVGYWFFLK